MRRHACGGMGVWEFGGLVVGGRVVDGGLAGGIMIVVQCEHVWGVRRVALRDGSMWGGEEETLAESSRGSMKEFGDCRMMWIRG